MLYFEVLKLEKNTNARLGRMKIGNEVVETPVFMAVGTKGTIKTLDSKEIEDINGGIILANTYHLWLSPGLKILNENDGIKNMMNYHHPMLTDSGGFQVFSLSNLRKIKEEGVYFTNPSNGDKLFLSPEKSIEIQEAIGADIMMCFDECPDSNHKYEYMKNSVERTLRWAKRCKDAKKTNQYLFGINQGGLFEDLRQHSAEELRKMDFDGYSIGGLSVGETKEEMYRITKFLNDHLPKDKPRYLMGVGGIDDLIENIKNGVDMFDCVMPTRNSRHGMFYTMEGKFNIKSSIFENDNSPLDTLLNHKYSNYKKSYLRHLFKEKEMLVFRILTYHNLMFMKYFVSLIKDAIKNDKLLEFEQNIRQNTNYYK